MLCTKRSADEKHMSISGLQGQNPRASTRTVHRSWPGCRQYQTQDADRLSIPFRRSVNEVRKHTFRPQPNVMEESMACQDRHLHVGESDWVTHQATTTNKRRRAKSATSITSTAGVLSCPIRQHQEQSGVTSFGRIIKSDSNPCPIEDTENQGTQHATVNVAQNRSAVLERCQETPSPEQRHMQGRRLSPPPCQQRLQEAFSQHFQIQRQPSNATQISEE